MTRIVALNIVIFAHEVTITADIHGCCVISIYTSIDDSDLNIVERATAIIFQDIIKASHPIKPTLRRD